MSAPECDIKKKREIRRAKVAFLYYDAIKTLENTAFSRVFCYLGRSERISKNPFSSFRDIHTRMTVNQHCPEKINSTGGDKRRSLWYNGAEYKKGGI